MIGDPRDLPGVVGWYSAESITTLGDGNDVATWPDLSGNGNDLTMVGTAGVGPVWRPTGGPAGGPSVQFLGGGSGGYFLAPNIWGADGFGVGATAGTMFAYIISGADGGNPYPGPWSIGQISNDECHYPFTPSGHIYEHMGLASGIRPDWTPALAVNAWRRFYMESSPGLWSATLDEGSAGSGSALGGLGSGSVRWAQAPLIGTGWYNTGPDIRFKGRMSLIILTDGGLTTGEKADLAAWATANPSGGVLSDPPGEPQVFAVDEGSHSLTFGWDLPLSGGTVSGYEIRIDGGAPIDMGLFVSHTFTGLTPDTDYLCEARAYGPGGTSDWAGVTITTLEGKPPGWYRVAMSVGATSWDVERGDAPDYGIRLPLTQGWAIPDQVDYFPAQADPTTLVFQVLAPTAGELLYVDVGETVTFAMYLTDDVSAEPWQTFAGIVTQADGAFTGDGDWLVTVFASDDVLRLDQPVAYTVDWPLESIADRVARIAAEAGVTLTLTDQGGLSGLVAARLLGSPVTALAALRDALRSAASDNTSEPPDEYYGRYVFRYVHATTDLSVFAFERRVFAGSTTDLDGCYVDVQGSWGRLPGPAGRASWVLLDGVPFGTPAGAPLVVSSNLVDTTPGPNPSADTRDNLGESLLPDGSTQLNGWYARAIEYTPHREGIDLVAAWDLVAGWTSYAPLDQVLPVVVTDLAPAYQVQDQDYMAGTLTGAKLTIPPGGEWTVELRLRPELLPGTDLP